VAARLLGSAGSRVRLPGAAVFEQNSRGFFNYLIRGAMFAASLE